MLCGEGERNSREFSQAIRWLKEVSIQAHEETLGSEVMELKKGETKVKNGLKQNYT